MSALSAAKTRLVIGTAGCAHVHGSVAFAASGTCVSSTRGWSTGGREKGEMGLAVLGCRQERRQGRSEDWHVRARGGEAGIRQLKLAGLERKVLRCEEQKLQTSTAPRTQLIPSTLRVFRSALVNRQCASHTRWARLSALDPPSHLSRRHRVQVCSESPQPYGGAKYGPYAIVAV